MVSKSLARRLSMLPVLLVLGSLVLSGSAGATGTLDQQQTSWNAGTHVKDSVWVAQTFTAQVGGQLDQVDLLLIREGSPGALTVQIRTVSGGVPTSTVLASTTVAEASVPTTTRGWVSVAISAPSVAGTRYAIVLGAPAATGCPPVTPGGLSSCYDWSRFFSTTTDPYGGGAPQFSSDSGATWAPHPDFDDLAFKTYVTTAPPDTTAPAVTCSASPSTLKSNKHKLASITATVNVTDGGSGPAGFTLLSAVSNQADSGLANDDQPNDIQGWAIGTADTSGLLRTERYGSDRVYTLTYQGSDVAGNTTNCQTTVTIRKTA